MPYDHYVSQVRSLFFSSESTWAPATPRAVPQSGVLPAAADGLEAALAPLLWRVLEVQADLKSRKSSFLFLLYQTKRVSPTHIHHLPLPLSLYRHQTRQDPRLIYLCRKPLLMIHLHLLGTLAQGESYPLLLTEKKMSPTILL
jgi:hypothetical protein